MLQDNRQNREHWAGVAGTTEGQGHEGALVKADLSLEGARGRN